MRAIAVAVIAGAIVVGTATTIAVWQKGASERRQQQQEAEREDRAHRARLEHSRALREKPIDQIVAEARAREQVAADQQQAQEKARAREIELSSMDALCREAIRTKMGHLEPEDHRIPPANVEHGRTKLVYLVRLSNSFRAAAVGAVECSIRSPSGPAVLTRIRL